MFETPAREQEQRSSSDNSVSKKKSNLQVRFENPNYMPFPDASIDFDVVNELCATNDLDEENQER